MYYDAYAKKQGNPKKSIVTDSYVWVSDMRSACKGLLFDVFFSVHKNGRLSWQDVFHIEPLVRLICIISVSSAHNFDRVYTDIDKLHYFLKPDHVEIKMHS